LVRRCGSARLAGGAWAYPIVLPRAAGRCQGYRRAGGESDAGPIEVARRLATAADLPAVVAVEAVDSKSYGLDNQLTRGALEDGRQVLLRQTNLVLTSPRPRVDFLRSNGIPLPQLYAADDAGNSLWEFIPGRPLGDLVDEGTADDVVWHRTGAALAAVHAVTFPAPLQGSIGVGALKLRPIDPVNQLRAAIDDARGWTERHRPHLTPVLDQVATFTRQRAEQIRAERPTVTHGDVNLHNIIAGDQAVQLIDWDFPKVRYPLAELSALDEHAYLHGCVELPPAFFAGYGRAVPAELLLAYRIVGCFGWLSGDDWAQWHADPDLPIAARDRLNRWHGLLLAWADQTPELISRLA